MGHTVVTSCMPESGAPKVRRIVDKGFAQRLDRACDLNPRSAAARGRQAWLRRELASRGTKVSPEAVRKWFHGESRPKQPVAHEIAAVLNTDAAWLLMGVSQDFAPKEQRVRNAIADGGVNLVAGIIQMNGGVPSFSSKDENVDMTAIIHGEMHSIHVAAAQPTLDGKSLICTVPPQHDDLTVIGVVMRGPTRFDLLRIESDAVESLGKRRGGWFELTITRNGSDYITSAHKWPVIKSLKTL